MECQGHCIGDTIHKLIHFGMEVGIVACIPEHGIGTNNPTVGIEHATMRSMVTTLLMSVDIDVSNLDELLDGADL